MSIEEMSQQEPSQAPDPMPFILTKLVTNENAMSFTTTGTFNEIDSADKT